MRVIDGQRIETDCQLCGSTFTTDRDEDGYPDYKHCPDCRQLCRESESTLLQCEREWWEGLIAFLSQPLPMPQRHPDKCRFCGDIRPPLDEWGYCKVCVDGMARTNGD